LPPNKKQCATGEQIRRLVRAEFDGSDPIAVARGLIDNHPELAISSFQWLVRQIARARTSRSGRSAVTEPSTHNSGETVAEVETPLKVEMQVEGALPKPKTFGAGIFCIVCGAQPYPCCELVREDFDLNRFNPNGVPSKTPNPGFWYCREHSPKRRREASVTKESVRIL
jgi:hypothetical protein